MKAILILDKMPESCHGCRFHEVANVYTTGDVDVCNAHIEVIWEEDLKEKPKWCPLKPIPERWIYTTPFTDEGGGAYNSGKQDGYNACIDEILGEEE